jgi:hypothetical protein
MNMPKFFRSRRPKHRATAARPAYGYKFAQQKPDLCNPCVDLYGLAAVMAAHEAIRLDVPDAKVASWHGLNEQEWRELPSLVKADHRESYHRAWGLGR